MSSLLPPGADPRTSPAWLRFIPAFGVLRNYKGGDLRADAMAGLTVAAVAVPQAMAYAMIAGLPVEHGLYTAIVMTFVGALFDSSRQLINGPTNAISIAALSVLAPLATPNTLVELAILLAFLVGAIQLGITALKLGDLSRYISHSVILGFTTGASALLVLDQLKNLFGVPAGGGVHDGFLTRFWATWTSAEGVQRETTWVGLGTIAAVLGLRWVKARFGLRLLPELLIVVGAASFVSSKLDLATKGVKVVGEIPARLPSFQLPNLNVNDIQSLSSGALAIALLGLLEAISMAKAIASQTRQRLDMNQQCLSEGLANVVGSFFQCYPGSGSLTRSYINQQAGAVSQWSGVFSAGAVALTVLLFAPAAQTIPKAALAGILMVSAFKMVDWRGLAFSLRATRFDAIIVTVTALSAVVISVEFCVLIGVLLSFLLAVPRVGNILLTEFVSGPGGSVHEKLPTDTPCPQLLIFGLEGELFFGAAASFEAQLHTISSRLTAHTRVLVLRIKRVRNPDAVGLHLLNQFINDVQSRGIDILLCGVRADLLIGLERTGIVERLKQEHLFVEQPVRLTSTMQAVEYAYRLLPSLCADCPRRAVSTAPPKFVI